MLSEYTTRVSAGKDLSYDEAEKALEAILAPQTPDTEIARFLVALSDKGEAAEEIAGFTRVMRAHAVPVDCKHKTFVDTAGTGGGVDTFNISTAAAFVIAATGLPVAKHGNRAITSRSGSADVLEHLGVRIEAPPEVAQQTLNQVGICFMFAPHFHPAMKRVAGIRRELERRTIFNLLGPLLNPASAPCLLVGVYAEELTQKLAKALCLLGCRRAWVVHSHDGLDELSVAESSRVAEVRDGQVRTFDFQPVSTHPGIPPGGTAAENALLIEAILQGQVSGAAHDVVVLNAAAARHLALDVPFSEALRQAETAISSGAALRKLRELAELTSE
jgi:anthranilate phosphoribosyltransferase